MALNWHSLSNVLLTHTAVTDEGITALVQYCHSLSNVLLTNTAVTDEGRLGGACFAHAYPGFLGGHGCPRARRGGPEGLPLHSGSYLRGGVGTARRSRAGSSPLR